MGIPYKKNKTLFFIISLIALYIVFWGVQAISLQALLINKHRAGEDQLLTYVADLRRELKDYRFLPYTLTENPSIRRFLSDPDASNNTLLRTSIERQLEDLNKASQTQAWFVLDNEGQVLLSSTQSEADNLSHYFEPHHLKIELESQKGESILLSGYNKTNQQITHLVLAPIYQNNIITGSIGVRVNLNRLIESWTVVGDLIAITGQNHQVFLANNSKNIFDLEWDKKLSSIRFVDQTKSKLYESNDEKFLLQNVLLDDLAWTLHFLTPLQQIVRAANFIAFGGVILISLILTFLLYRRERSLKIASAVENQRLVSKNTQLQRALIENTHVGLIQLTHQGVISFINPTGHRYFQKDHDLIGTSLRNLLSIEDCDPKLILQLDTLFQSASDDKFIEQEVVFKKSLDQTFPALLSVSPIEWSDSQGYLVTVINISKRKQAEQALTKINQQLEVRVSERTEALKQTQKELLRSEKLAAIGQMSTAIAHELNQPLTGIRTLVYSAELLLQRNNIEETQATLVKLEQLVSRMHSLTSELKVLAYRRPENLTKTNCEECFTNALVSLGDQTSPLRIIKEFQHTFVYAEPTRLERIFSNLIKNTLEACEENAIAPEILIKTKLDTASKNLIIELSDNGPGTSKDTLPHLLEPFYTSKPVGKGLGLGLAISASLANDMKGQLIVGHSQQGGLTFTLTLQRAE
ncbi:ATP-binding protein [Marinomonas sp. 15G1-11]|uniref:histidine kinase n=1 Tax=Marinomonas phaeophyticola TaxID=3004091 RepID=A0ABT4JQT6_9GAMM|nr:ATP-binding protein [Marinomonas sp. 15G1-11]MCZ2720521.1 ATP-binding protein [Marinomonas sp. 15G1-11]